VYLESAKNALSESKFAEAMRSLRQAAALRPGPDLERWKAITHLQNRDFHAALECYRAAHE
jgi:Flp pilus assembly protein TadD